AQPGVKTVECVETASGRQSWQAVLPELVNIVGLASDLLLVRTETDLHGLDVAAGTTRWRAAAPNILGFPRCDENRILFATSEPVNGGDERQIRLNWLNVTDGRPIATCALEPLADRDPRFGPIVCTSEKTFAFFGRGQQDVTRDVVELR